MDEHLDSIALDELRRGEGSAAAREHLDSCEPCRAEADSLAGIVQALRDDDDQGRPVIPPEIDRQVLEVARRRAASIRARGVIHRHRWLRPAVGMAIAAGALLSMRLSFDALPSPGSRAEKASGVAVTAQQTDLDGDGRVTILDAFALARQPASPSSEIEDERKRSVARIADLAVSVERGA